MSTQYRYLFSAQRALLSAPALCLSATLFSAFNARAETLSTGAASPVVVTATRTAQPLDAVIGSVSVITREEIDQQQHLSLQQLLRQQAGLDLTSQGGLGKLTSLFIRGTEPEHVLVLIDGVRIGSITAGTNPFEYLPLEQIERIEIVRGPRSSLYGADAIGGVIQIFTRGGGDQASITVGGGSHGTTRDSASFSLREGDTWLSLNGSYLYSDGINACRGSVSGGCFTIEPDKDGFVNRAGSARVGHQWSDVAKLEGSVVYSSGFTEFDGGFTNQTRFREFVPTIRAELRPIEQLRLTASAGVSRDDQDNFKDGRTVGYFNSERRNASLQADIEIGSLLIVTGGYDYLDDQVASSTLFDVTTRDNAGIFGQVQLALGSHRVSASARQDDNEQFGSHSTSNAGWKWLINDYVSPYAAWGTAFRAPSFNDLYYPGFSNPLLKPEESQSYEVGVQGQASVWHGSLSIYRNEIDQLIELDSTFTPANVAEADIRGIEMASGVTIRGWDVDATYSYTDPRNRVAGPHYDKVLLRRARKSATLVIAHQWASARIAVTGRAQGQRFNNGANTSELAGYATADLTGEYWLTKQVKFAAKISNVFDKSYETVRFYHEAPRTLFFSIEYRPAGLN